MKSESLESVGPPGKPCFVVDSWPILEWFYGREPAATVFQERLLEASEGRIRLIMSRINRGEVVYNAAIKLGVAKLNEIKSKFDALPIDVVAAEDWAVDAAADLKVLYPISYADCFVAVLAQASDSPVITGDPDFLKLQSAGLVDVVWLGR